MSTGDPKFFIKSASAGDEATYVPKENDSLYALDGSGDPELVPKSDFAPSSHTHVSADITDASDGGNNIADAGKLLKFRATGGIEATTNASGIAVAGSSVDGVGVDARSVNSWALYAGSTNAQAGWFVAAGPEPAVILNANSTGLALRAQQQGAGADDIASFEGTSGSLIIGTDGGLDGTGTWDATTKANLSLNNVENTALSTWAGSTNLTTLGTVSTGTWAATAIGATRGGTGQTAWTLGDLLYSNGVNSLAKLAGNTTTDRMYLSQRGDGANSAAPSWRQINQGELTGFGTGVQTALAVNVGSAGAPVLFNGALGTPTSGTLTNCTFPTLNQNTTGSAASLTTGRTIQTDLSSTSSASFDGTANITPGVTGTLPIANGGTGATTESGALTNLGITRVHLTGDVTNSTTSYADATGLSFALAANTTYSFVFHVLVTTPATTQGYNIAINGPTAPTAFAYQSMQPLSNSTQAPSHQTAYDTGTSGSTAPAGTFVVVIPGTIVTGASSGTLIIRFLSETGGQTVTVKAGSTGVLTTFP